MRFARSLPLALACAAALAGSTLAGCASAPPPPEVVTLAQAEQIVGAPDRTEADRVNDRRRKPAQMLAFIGIRPGITAFDVSTGGGYTTELLARAVGPAGRVFGQSQPRDGAHPMPRPAASEGGAAPATSPAAAATAAAPAPRTPADVLAAREQRLRAAGVAAAPMVYVASRYDDPIPPELTPGRLDLVTLMFNYHDLGWQGVDRRAMNSAIFQALKPGGLYVIADHAGRPGTGISESGTLHRVEESFVRGEVEAAGFRLAQEGTFLRNPDDPRDRNTPEPPQPKDEFVLKFVKPR
ncbi:MAG: class I SAM-dependent methyltransferase [Burkholderiaceae bacterium]